MTGRIFLKLIIGVIGLLLLAAISVDYFATEVTKNTYIQNLTRQLADKGAMLAISLPMKGDIDPERARILAQAAGVRLTVIRADGQVLADSEANPAGMENHRMRPELIEAFNGRVGSVERVSATIGVPFLYVATPVEGGAIRLAVPLSEINRQVSQIRTENSGEHGPGLPPGAAHCGPAGTDPLPAALRRSLRTRRNWRAVISARGSRTPTTASSVSSSAL